MDRLQTVTRGIFLRTVSTVVVALLGLLTSVVLNRYYGKTDYALLVLVYSVTGLCVIFSDLGTKRTINRYVPIYSASGNGKALSGLIGTSIIFQIVGMGVFAAALYLLTKPISIFIFHKPQLIPILKAGAIFFIGVSIAEFLSLLFQSMQAWWKDALVSTLYPLIYLLIICLFSFLLNLPIKFVLYANALSGIIVLIIAIFIFPKSIRSSLFRNFNLRSMLDSSKTIFSFGLPLIFSGFGFYLFFWFDKIMLGRYRTAEELTFYYIAFLFLNAFMMLFKVLYSVFMPYLAEISILPREIIKEKFKLFSRWFLQITILMSLGMYFLIEPIVKILYGPGYYPSIIAFKFLLIVFILRAANHPQGMFLINVFGKSKQALLLNVALVSTNVLLDIILIPKYGYFGAIAASIAGYCVFWVGMVGFVSIIRQMFPVKVLVKSLVCLTGIGLIYLSFKSIGFENAYILGFGLPLVYLLLLKLFGEIETRDIELIKQIIKSLSIRGIENYYTPKGNF
jgi:O-antigen/teichoic acid export membrane protein